MDHHGSPDVAERRFEVKGRHRASVRSRRIRRGCSPRCKANDKVNEEDEFRDEQVHPRV
jgi:hypothetical protein